MLRGLKGMKGLTIGGGIIALAVVGALVGWNRPQWPDQMEFQGRFIPVGGLELNPEGKDHPGDPTEAERDLAQIYKGLKRYVALHGKFPMPGELAGSPENKGLLPREYFLLPDLDYADYASKEDENMTYAFAYRAPRFDMSPKPIAPANGQRDVWMYTDVYVRRNTKVFRDGSREINPEGVYVVLWSDGEIERIHPLDVVWTGPDGNQIMRFPGEPGTEKLGTPERERIRKARGVRLIGNPS